MATTTTRLCFSPSLLSYPTQNPQHHRANLSYAPYSLSCTPLPFNTAHFSHLRSRRNGQRIFAMNSDVLGDLGGRDPFAAEIESNFGEKVLGNVDTEHRILIPNLSAVSLAHQSCNPVSPSQAPMSKDDAQNLLRKVVGWRLVDGEVGLRLQCLWKLRNFGCGVELINRIYGVVDPTGHYPNLHLEQPNRVRAELWTASIGGLSINDFIVAAKMDAIKTSDLVPKKRIWA
eukprot:TRINITY_DN26999_c0_g1_i1.p1 TRINITY_DN26999_c0_g1~~TRINITY_DN26999_c0_g1_i1.p1  ORF type:complete len:260 (+),score=25.90 TRINITY_DN26999_c0_g1_i1:92-781(+)